MPVSFLAPQFLWLLAALPAIIMLHYIRARRQPYQVSALFLWHQAQALAQQRRRFSPTWLLLLQLLFVTVLALALAQPTLSFAGLPDRVLVIDASASMAARDSDGVRLAKAVEDAEALLSESGRVAVVRAGLEARVVQPLTDDHGEVRRALSELRAADARAELRRAVDLAQALAPDATVHLFSDSPRPTGASVRYHSVAGDGYNLGISAFELRANQAFVSVVSSSPRPEQVELELTREGDLVGRTTLLVPARGQAHHSFPVEGGAGFYRASLSTSGADALELDNEAYAGSRALEVLVSPPSSTVERALRALPELRVRTSGSLAVVQQQDAVVLTGPVPEPLPPGRYVIFAAASESPRYQRLVDWDRADPLLRFVDLTSVVVGIHEDFALPAVEGDWQVLAETEQLEPALMQLQSAEHELIVFPFHPSQTDLTRRAAFPILMANIMQRFRLERRLTLGSTLAPQEGEGARYVLEPGVIELGGERYSASLLSAEQSRIPRAEATSDAPEEAAPGEAVSERQQSFGLWLTLLALLLLLAEWLLWSRQAGPALLGRRSSRGS